MISKSITFSEVDPLLLPLSAATMAEKLGFAEMKSSDAAPLRRPEDAAAVALPTDTRLRVDASELIITETPLLNQAEQADAREALLADGVFESAEWPSRYLDRDFPGQEGNLIRFEESELVAAGIKFGWAIEQAVRIAAAVEDVPSKSRRLEISFNLPTRIDAKEHLFIGLELQRRGVYGFDLILPWGGRWEPGVDWIGDIEEFEKSICAHQALAERNGGWRLGFDHVEEKFSVLPILHARCGDALHLNVDGLGWIEATRLLARREPDLLRALLVLAQDRFAFDKPNEELATTEDDIRSLPDVPDSELERVFVEDFRGRQLLHVTAASLMADEKLRLALRAVVERCQRLHEELVAASVRRLLSAWSSGGSIGSE